MPRYLLSIIQPDGPPPPPEFLGPIMADLVKVNADLSAAGARVFAAGLTPPSGAKVLKLQDGEVQVTDGPFVEAKAQIGGFTVIEVADETAALAWGGRFAKAITLPIEVRALQPDHPPAT
ncbi:MAG: YciI family protein [Phenylobacterium sp.]|uniref:YciI family protein n=1 Tax=Phenylobacterium sp. TaxID=1871053 RepID=UPI00271A3F07|nr:YciI family protein [Phenylobacterium sp.]MDO8914171.1 YciI family protein [Phenylobacterium sp.]MDP3101494.1 YciI family protein [Phenylobacterium sp.]HQT55745.1 YciI family protein [Phenylobacterium sp.]